MKRSHFRFALTGPIPAVLSLAIIGSLAQTGPPANLDWPFYGNDLGGMRYVGVDQINPSNVANLSPVWILHTNVFNEHTSFESQPIIVNGVLYVTSPYGHVFAVEAATGAIK